MSDLRDPSGPWSKVGDLVAERDALLVEVARLRRAIEEHHRAVLGRSRVPADLQLWAALDLWEVLDGGGRPVSRAARKAKHSSASTWRRRDRAHREAERARRQANKVRRVLRWVASGGRHA